MINRCYLEGNLTNSPELRSTQGGTVILEFGLAVNERRRNPQTGEWDERPNFFSLKVFGNRAEALSRILTKGMHVTVEGHLHWDSWEDKNGGGRRSKTEVVVDEIALMSQRQGNAPQSAPAPQYAPQQQPTYANPPQPQMAPQMPSQAPTAAPAYGGYQQPQQPEFFSEDIPF